MDTSPVTRVFLDSGAPTLYNRLVRVEKGASHMGSHIRDRRHDDFSFITSEEYLTYRDKYIDFIKTNERLLEVYANLDIINNPAETWENQKYLESKGVKPIPVFHFGSNLKWLKMYMDKGYKYIAIGGMVPNPPSVLVPALDNIWSNVLTDNRGMPKVKIHGFAMTSVKLMCRYPWYSVDSASWVKYAMYGAILVPKLCDGKFVWNQNPNRIFVSSRSNKTLDSNSTGFGSLPKAVKRVYLQYIEDHGYQMGKSSFRFERDGYKPAKDELVHKDPETCPQVRKAVPEGHIIVEHIEVLGLANSYMQREQLNAEFYLGVQRSRPEWPWPFKHKRRGLF